MQGETSVYHGRVKSVVSCRRDSQGYDSVNSDHDHRDQYSYGSDSFSEKQTERDWDRRISRERTSKTRFSDYPVDDEDERTRYSKSTKPEYKRYSGNGEKRSSRDDSDRRPYYDNSPRSRDVRERDVPSKDGAKERDTRDSSSSRESRRREYRESRSSRDLLDSRDVKDGRTRSSRDVKSVRDRDRRESRLHEKDYDSDDRDRRVKDNGSPESLDNYDHGNDYHGGRGSVYSSGDSRYMDGDSYKNQAPNNTVMIRGLAQHIMENDIRQDILQCGLMPKDIRLIRKKDTGASRGFAFVEFNTLQEASRWMEMKQGVLMLQDQYRAVMHFSIPKEPSFDRTLLKGGSQDWHCVICSAHNFKRRDTCFKCHASRQVSEEGGEGSDEVSPHPTNTVLLRNLDVLSTEDSVLQALKHQQFSNLPIRSIRIGQDALTNTSRGICYVELNNVLDSVYLHDALSSDPLIVDGRKALVSYCKLPQMMSGTLSGTNNSNQSESESRWNSHSGDGKRQYGAEDIPRLAEYCASLYASSTQEHTAYVQYYKQYYENQLAQGGTITLPSQTQTDSVNAAAALAQSAIQQVQAAKEIKKQIDDPRQGKSDDKASYEVYKMAQLKGHSTSGTYHPTPPVNLPSSATSTLPFIVVPPPGSSLPKYPVPDASTYQYDETSGYYYDSQTGLYYDANSQYYYNGQTQQFLYWEAEKQTYMPAPPMNNSSNEDSSSQKEEGKKGKPEKQDKVKVAKKIAKDMERWAKTLNQKKENARQNVTLASSAAPLGKSVGAADAGYAILERKERLSQEMGLASMRENDDKSGISQAPGGGATGLVAAYGGGSESDEEIEDVLQEDRQHTNWVKLACLLCKRQFPSKESLVRHQQLSDLHKQNLEMWYKVRGLDPHDPQQRNNKYRDRAKERRLKFGEPNPPHPNRLKEKYLKAKEEAVSVSYEEPTKRGIGSENVGNKLLQKMGWQEGMGLGKANQGRTSIIQPEHRNSTAGLGSKDSTYGVLPGETYKDCVKKMMFARYQELTEQEQGLDS